MSITRDTVTTVSEVSIRELRNHGGQVVDRVAKGERLTITRSGKPVAELRPLGREPVSLELLIGRRRSLPVIDPEALRRDVDEVLDPSI
jgi:prevent-host-death family protein